MKTKNKGAKKRILSWFNLSQNLIGFAGVFILPDILFVLCFGTNLEGASHLIILFAVITILCAMLLALSGFICMLIASNALSKAEKNNESFL